MNESNVDMLLDSELEHNERLRDLYIDEEELVAKEEWLRTKGIFLNNKEENFFYGYG